MGPGRNKKHEADSWLFIFQSRHGGAYVRSLLKFVPINFVHPQLHVTVWLFKLELVSYWTEVVPTTQLSRIDDEVFKGQRRV
jgi:hypothetical protein